MLLNAQTAAAQQEARAHRSARHGKFASTQWVSPGTREIRFRQKRKIPYSTEKSGTTQKKFGSDREKSGTNPEKFGVDKKIRSQVAERAGAG